MGKYNTSMLKQQSQMEAIRSFHNIRCSVMFDIKTSKLKNHMGSFDCIKLATNEIN